MRGSAALRLRNDADARVSSVRIAQFCKLRIVDKAFKVQLNNDGLQFSPVLLNEHNGSDPSMTKAVIGRDLVRDSRKRRIRSQSRWSRSETAHSVAYHADFFCYGVSDFVICLGYKVTLSKNIFSIMSASQRRDCKTSSMAHRLSPECAKIGESLSLKRRRTMTGGRIKRFETI